MKLPLVLSLAAALVAGAIAPARAEVESRLLRLSADCSCDSGNGLVSPDECGGSYSPAVQRMYDEATGQMISCCRPRAVQDFLIRCYNRCGQPGRAVQNSRHVTGQACDASNGSIGHRYGLDYVPHHGSNHFQDTSGRRAPENPSRPGKPGRTPPPRGGDDEGDDDSGDDENGDDEGDDDSGDDEGDDEE